MSLLCCTGLYLHGHITYASTGIQMSGRDGEGEGRQKERGREKRKREESKFKTIAKMKN